MILTQSSALALARSYGNFTTDPEEIEYLFHVFLLYVFQIF